MAGKYLVFPLLFFFFNSYGQSNYVIEPACNNIGNRPLVVFFTGDGGRSTFDRKIEDSLCVNGMAFMGINSYKYFRKRKTPQQTLDSILPYIELNLRQYNLQRIILAGYSFGSEVVPFIYNLMSKDWQNKVAYIVLISPSGNSDFKIHFLDQIGLTLRHWPYNVVNEILKIDEKKIIVFWGKNEKKFTRKQFTRHNITVHQLKGGHRHTEIAPVFEKIKQDVSVKTAW